MDYFAHYGTILSVYPEVFSFNDALRKNKILGIINWKIRHEVWSEVFKTQNSLAKIRNNFTGLLSNICAQSVKESSKKGGNNSGSKIAWVLSTGHEDIILVVLTRSLQFPKFLSTKLRSIEFKDLIPSQRKKSNIKHITVSTYTVLGAQIKKGDFIYEYPKGTISKQMQDQLKWDSCFSVRPGHLENAASALESKRLRVYPVAGRYDIIASSRFDRKITSTQFLRSHHRLIGELKNNRSILSSETHLSFPNLRGIETQKEPGKLKASLPILPDINSLNQYIYESSNLHILEKESFAQIIRKLQYLLEDKYLRESFMTLTPVIFSGVRQYVKLKIETYEMSPTSDLWTSLVELCFATRYKGSAPAGETAVSPTLGDYSTGEKCLTLLDLLGNRIIKSIITKYPTVKLKPLYVANISISSPTSASVPTIPIPTVFILLPPRPLFYPQFLLLTFCHELGHVIFNSFSLSVGAKLRYEVINVVKRLAEPVAELFSIKMLSNMDFDKHKKITKTVLGTLKMKRTLYNKLYSTKCQQIDLGKALYEIAKCRVGETDIRKLIVTELKEQKVKTEELLADIGAIAKALVGYINFLDCWDDEIIQKVREFFSSKDTQEEFWNLWTYLYTLGMQCYFTLGTEQKKRRVL
jgi:hypothetical protein